MPVDDNALMRAIASGDQAALAALYDRYSPALLAICVRVLGDRSQAEDVLVDLFYEVWRKGERFDASRGTPLSYLVTLARSRSIDRRRARGRHPEVPWENDGAVTDPADKPVAGQRGPSTTPLADAVGRERRARIQKALNTLSPGQRRAVELSYFEGLSHREIADKSGLPLGTVKSHIRLGLIQLRDLLRNEYESDDTTDVPERRAP